VPALLDALLTYMIRGCLEQASDRHPAAGWSAALADPAITAALNRMHADPARRWTVAELPLLRACPGQHSPGGSPCSPAARRWPTWAGGG
jgi:hypothetical protein